MNRKFFLCVVRNDPFYKVAVLAQTPCGRQKSKTAAVVVVPVVLPYIRAA